MQSDLYTCSANGHVHVSVEEDYLLFAAPESPSFPSEMVIFI
jgi:hypothetical protein